MFNKRLGQHFLKSEKAIDKIIASLGLEKGDLVIEIGPGKGILTRPLLKHCQKNGASLLLIEKDRQLALGLYQELKDEKDFKIEAADILKTLEKFTPKNRPYFLVGNLPYYISGQLLRQISELGNKPKASIFMLQKEVAQRIASLPPETNLLSASVQVWAKPKLMMDLGPDDFEPAPKVKSTIIYLTTHKDQLTEKDLENYYLFLKKIFKQPRKTLLNNLCETNKEIKKETLIKFLQEQGLNDKTRAQTLSVEKLKNLAQRFKV